MVILQPPKDSQVVISKCGHVPRLLLIFKLSNAIKCTLFLVRCQFSLHPPDFHHQYSWTGGGSPFPHIIRTALTYDVMTTGKQQTVSLLEAPLVLHILGSHRSKMTWSFTLQQPKFSVKARNGQRQLSCVLCFTMFLRYTCPSF